jgi:hypothetical protein
MPEANQKTNVDKYLPRIQKMCLLYDNLMRVALSDNLESVEDLLRTSDRQAPAKSEPNRWPTE